MTMDVNILKINLIKITYLKGTPKVAAKIIHSLYSFLEYHLIPLTYKFIGKFVG